MQKKIDAEPAKETVKPTYRSFRTQYLEIHHALGRNKSAFFILNYLCWLVKLCQKYRETYKIKL